MRRLSGVLLSLCMSTSLYAADDVPERPLPNYPHTRSVDLVEEQFGEKVADPLGVMSGTA